VDLMKEPKRTVLLWLLDLCVEVSNVSHINKMTPQNLAIVIGPNLFTPATGADPMATLQFSQKVANFLTNAIIWRKSEKDASRGYEVYTPPPIATSSASTPSASSSSVSSSLSQVSSPVAQSPTPFASPASSSSVPPPPPRGK